MSKELATPILVRMVHIRKAHQCSQGARKFFERHGLDWTQFLMEGIPVELIEATGDAMALKVAKVARDGG